MHSISSVECAYRSTFSGYPGERKSYCNGVVQKSRRQMRQKQGRQLAGTYSNALWQLIVERRKKSTAHIMGTRHYSSFADANIWRTGEQFKAISSLSPVPRAEADTCKETRALSLISILADASSGTGPEGKSCGCAHARKEE